MSEYSTEPKKKMVEISERRRAERRQIDRNGGEKDIENSAANATRQELAYDFFI